MDRVFRGQGRAEGEARGRAEQLADAILEVLQVRGIEPSHAEAERVHACADLAQLHTWLRAAVTATTVGEVLV